MSISSRREVLFTVCGVEEPGPDPQRRNQPRHRLRWADTEPVRPGGAYDDDIVHLAAYGGVVEEEISSSLASGLRFSKL